MVANGRGPADAEPSASREHRGSWRRWGQAAARGVRCTRTTDDSSVPSPRNALALLGKQIDRWSRTVKDAQMECRAATNETWRAALDIRLKALKAALTAYKSIDLSLAGSFKDHLASYPQKVLRAIWSCA